MVNTYGKPLKAHTQHARIIAALKHYGDHGITLVSFQAPNVCDNGTPIVRMQTRIHELKEKGWNIINVTRVENRAKRHKCDVYVLRDRLPTTQMKPLSPPRTSFPTMQDEISRQNKEILDKNTQEQVDKILSQMSFPTK